MNETATTDFLDRLGRGSSNLKVLIDAATEPEEIARLTGKRNVLDTCAKLLRDPKAIAGINGMRAYLNMIEVSPKPGPGERDGASLVRDYLRSYEDER